MMKNKVEAWFSRLLLVLIGCVASVSAFSMSKISEKVRPLVNLCGYTCNADNQCQAGGEGNSCTHCRYVFIYSDCQ
jgi:hypothetical protein